MSTWLATTDQRGASWHINWDGITQTIRSYLAALHTAQSMRVEIVQESAGFFDTMTVQNITTDWEDVRKRTQSRLANQLSKWRNGNFKNFAEMHKDLVCMRSAARHYKAGNNRFVRSIVEANTKETQKHISRLDATIKGLQWVRDISTTTLVIGSGFISGGASVAVLGGGSALTGVGRYQDSGNIGSAVIDATGTFVMGSFALRGVKGPLAALPKASKRAFFWLAEMPLNALFDISTDLLEGQSLANAGIDFGLKTAGDHLFEAAAGSLLKRLPMPVRKKIRHMPYNLRIPFRGVVDVIKERGLDASSEKLLSVKDTTAPKSLVFTAHHVPNQPPDDDNCYVNTYALRRV